MNDPLTECIITELGKAEWPLETVEIVDRVRMTHHDATRAKVLHRLRELAMAGRVKKKTLSRGTLIWNLIE